MASNFFASLTRKKTIDENSISQLARILTLVDLAALGVGSTLGLGIYVLAGSVAKSLAGPAVCISFLVAAVASAFAALCYAEFASRVPKAGSAYVYSYVTVGEFVAYIIGWNLILEYAIGTASTARGLSGYIDYLANEKIKEGLTSVAHMHVGFLAEYPDFLSFGFVLFLTVLLSIGIKESTRLNNLFTVLNLATVIIVIVTGIIKADPYNWNIPKDSVTVDPKNETVGDIGEGGFLPFGLAGMMAGAAKCFFGFVGFDAIAATGEEAINPQRTIPLAIIISLIICFLAYFGISSVLTLMWPYYLQDSNAPLPYVFEQLDLEIIKWIVNCGAIVALCASLMGAMFPLPRIIYAMSSDGLLFKALAKINAKTQTPIFATVIAGILVSLMTLLFDKDQLIDMMSIGTLMAYTIVAVCVLLLRYKPAEETKYPDLELKTARESPFGVFKLAFNLNNIKKASDTSFKITNWALVFFSVFAGIFDAFIIFLGHKLARPYVLVPFILVTIVMLLLLAVIIRQPVDEVKLNFKVPWVPFIPCLSVLINFYLMLVLDSETWIRFAGWLVVGFLIYFAYGMRKSEEGSLRTLQKSEISVEKDKEVTRF